MAVGPQISGLWQLGSHRLFCGSALERASYQTLMRDDGEANEYSPTELYSTAVWRL